MDSEEQKRAIEQVFSSLSNKLISFDKRIANLESSEYASLNFYASMYQLDVPTIIAVASANIYYPITGMTVGLIKGFTFAASVLTCAKAGVYKISATVSISNMQNNNAGIAVTLNNAVLPQTANDFFSSSLGGHQEMGSTGLVRLVVGDTIRLAIVNKTDADDPTIDSASLVLNRVGD